MTTQEEKDQIIESLEIKFSGFYMRGGTNYRLDDLETIVVDLLSLIKVQQEQINTLIAAEEAKKVSAEVRYWSIDTDQHTMD